MNKKTFTYLPLFFSLVVMSLTLVTRTRFLIDSDMSSEMILGKILATEGKLLLTNSWFYSTEIRVLNSQLIFGILFRFMNNWFHIRLISSYIIFSILALVLYKFMALSDLKKYYPLALMCYFMPLCMDTLNFYLINLGYIVYVIYTFVALVIFISYLNSYKKQHIIISFIVAVLFSMCGSRPILHIYIPLLLTSLFLNVFKDGCSQFKDSLFSLITFIGSIIGYLLNKYILSELFVIPGAFNITINLNLNGIVNVIKGILNNNGFYENGIIGIIISIFLVVLSFAISIYSVINFKKIDKKYLSICVFYISNIIAIIMCFGLTNLPYAHRYILLSTIMSIPVFFTLNSSLFKPSKFLLSAVVFCYLFLGTYTYIKCNSIDKTSELDYISSELVASDYYNGYSTFWSSNVLTELSSGKIDVWCIGDRGNIPDDFKEIDEIYWWLQKREHAFSAPKGKVFILLENSYTEKLLDLIWYLTDEDVFLRTENYIIYSFESYDQMKDRLRGAK